MSIAPLPAGCVCRPAVARGGVACFQPLVLVVLVAVLIAGGGVRSWAQTENSHGKPSAADKPKAKAKAKLLERYRAKLEVTDDAEWNVIQDRIEKVLQAERELQTVLVVAHKNHGSSDKASGSGAKTSGHGDQVRSAEGEVEAEVRALQKLVEAKAPARELKPRLARVRELLRARQEQLANAREDLRAVLSSRQEAIAVLNGLLR